MVKLNRCPECGHPLPLPLNPKKVCEKCRKSKPIEEFPLQSINRDGLSCWCRLCEEEYCKELQTQESEQPKEGEENE